MSISPKLDVDTGDLPSAFRSMFSTNSAVTAAAGGGAANATPLTASFNRITTCASADDSVKLPPAIPGAMIIVRNGTGTAAAVFPATGQAINALSANTALQVAANTTRLFACTVAGKWDSL